MFGCARPHFDTITPSTGTTAVVAGNRLSYVFLSAAGPLGWSPAAGDFYVYYPSDISPWIVSTLTASGLILGKLIVEFMGIGLGSSLKLNPDWGAAFNISAGALYVESLSPLHIFGKICATILALGIVANNIPGTYSAALSFQLLGSWFQRIPCIFWSTFSVIVYTVCAVAGQSHLLSIFLNFLSLIGYWTVMWIAMTAEDHLIFRRRWSTGYDWEAWNDLRRLPLGLAALVAFLIGWAGAVLCMYQNYYVGPIAALVGEGADVSDLSLRITGHL